MTGTFFGTVDLAQVALYAFWIFFAGLVVYLQRENMREGYPLEDEDGNSVKPGLFGLPSPKTFILPDGRDNLTVPNDVRETREFAMERVSKSGGSPYEPTGDPMVDGVGPAAYAMRADVPEIDGMGHVKIQPMRGKPDYYHSAGRDPRGMPVIAGDGEVVGTISDMWIDVPEMLVRYLEVDLGGGGGSRLIPMPLARITGRGVRVHALYADQFAGVPGIAGDGQITKLEEEKVSAYFAGGKLYASRRAEPVLDVQPA